MNAPRPYVIVIGGGQVGYYLTRHLIERDYEVTLVEKDPARAEWIEHHLGTVSVMVGDGDELAFVATIGVERADVFVAATGDDEDNLVACQLAKERFGVARTIARVSNPANVQMFQTLGVDVAVSATELLMGLIETELSGSDTVRGVAVKATGASLVDIRVPEGSRFLGRPVGDITLPGGAIVVCIVRDARPVIPSPDVVVASGDELIIYATSLDVDGVRRAIAVAE